jgi:hypothetical protein
MAEEWSRARDGQPDSERLGRVITARCASSLASAEQIAQGATSLGMARAILASGVIAMRRRPQGRARRWPVSRGALKARRAAMAGRRARNLLARAGGDTVPERGVRLPCSRTGCQGVMQYIAEPFSVALADESMATSHFAWVCSAREQHAHRAQGLTARRRWEDDGGSGV